MNVNTKPKRLITKKVTAAKTLSTPEILTVPIIEGVVLGAKVFRGYARLCDLARISEADIYDPRTNPTGTQRDLSPKHAKDAYEYVKSRDLAFWPEVFLSARDKDAIAFLPQKAHPEFGNIEINVSRIKKNAKLKKISISRVDGNHRLHYADGETRGYPAVERVVSFCLAYNLSLDQEIHLFRDINNNQRRMNTSHLDNVQARLSPEEELKRNNPTLYIAKRLGEELDSPFHGRIYDGGKKAASSLIPLRTLKTGIEYMLSRPTKLTALPDSDSKYRVIKHYFSAVKKWVPDAWTDPKNYVLLRGAGLWATCFLGAEVIDRALSSGKFQPDDMLKILKSGRNWNWRNDGDFAGYSGRGGAVKIRDLVVADLVDDKGISMKDLYHEIMKG